MALCLAAPGIAFAQAPTPTPKIDNLQGVPNAVRPGVIETTYEPSQDQTLGGAPAVLSPYEPELPPNANAISFILSQVVIDGGGAVPQSEIEALYGNMLGREIKLAEIFDLARSITRLYAEAGYPLSLAYVPKQEIENGVVRIRIIEGFIGEVDITGAPSASVPHLQALGEKLKSERPLTQKALERYLLLANQLPGLKVTGVLERAANPDMGVKMTLQVEQKRFSIAGGINNRASAAVGRKQFYARLNANALFTGADDFNFAAVQSFELDELTYFSGGYGTVLNAEGLRLGLMATRSEAAPGIPFLRDLGFETQGWTAGVNLSYPVIVSRDQSLTFSATGKWKEFRSAFGVSPNTEDILITTELGVNYTKSDRWNGTNAVSLAMTRGWDMFGATQAGSPLASRAGAGGEFIAWSADLSRNQKLTDWLGALMSVSAQTANKPLLSSEQCGYGGAGYGRGFDPYVISGDKCAVGLVELQAYPSFLQRGKFSVSPYVGVDAGVVRQNGVLAAGEERTQTLYSFSTGARFTLTKYLSAGLEGAIPIKSVSPGDEKNFRFFFSIEARY